MDKIKNHKVIKYIKNKKRELKIVSIGITLIVITFITIQGVLINNQRPIEGITQYINSIKPVDYEYIHKMTNTVISADTKWGNIQINKKTLKNVKNSKIYKKDEIIQRYINQWENGDFENSDLFHNYVWDILDGNIGRAEGLDHTEIENTKKRLGL